MICGAGGYVLNSSFTGPGGVDLGQLLPSGQPDTLGNFDYSATVTRVSDTFILSGIILYC